MMADSARGPDGSMVVTPKIRAWLEDLRRKYGPRVIGQRPCTKLYSHYVVPDFTRLPQWDVIEDCDESCTKYVLLYRSVMCQVIYSHLQRP